MGLINQQPFHWGENLAPPCSGLNDLCFATWLNLSWSNLPVNLSGWWFQTWLDYFHLFSTKNGMSSLPLTKSIIFQDGHIAPPTSFFSAWPEYRRCGAMERATPMDRALTWPHGRLYHFCFQLDLTLTRLYTQFFSIVHPFLTKLSIFFWLLMFGATERPADGQ
jgi:hypothetical protein